MLSERIVMRYTVLYNGRAKDTPEQTKGNKSSDCRMRTDSVPRGWFCAEDI